MSEMLSKQIDLVEDQDLPLSEEVPLLQSSLSYSGPSLTLSWIDLSCTVSSSSSPSFFSSSPSPLSPSKEHILISSSGIASPGSFLAIMGPSGSGKSTLLHILSGNEYKHPFSVSGNIYANGFSIDSIPYKSFASFVPQQSDLMSTLTPREILRFSLKMRKALSSSEIDRKVSSVLWELKLESVADCLVGDFFSKGLSGGEKKRLTIGIELISEPSILILDEPSSGLDSVSANLVIDLLKEQCERGKTIITTIHQPSSSIFDKIDDLILLSEGRQVYRGQAKEALDYFKQIGLECPENSNPADFFTRVLYTKNKKEKTEEEEERQERLIRRFEESKRGYIEKPVQSKIEEENNIQILSEIHKFICLLERTCLIVLRTPQFTFIKLTHFLIYAAIMDMIYFDLGDGADDFPARNAFFYNMVTDFLILTNQNSILAFQSQKSVVFNEMRQGLYGVTSFFICKIVSEFPLSVIFSLIHSASVYWAVGLDDRGYKFLVFYLVLFFCHTFSSVFGFFISVFSKDMATTFALAPMVAMILLMYGGYFSITSDSVNYYIKYLSPFYYGYLILAVNDYTDCDTELCKADPLDRMNFSEEKIEDAFVGFASIIVLIFVITWIVFKIKYGN